MTTNQKILGFCLALTMSACSTYSDFKTTTEIMQPVLAPREVWVLSFVNDQQKATLDMLDNECSIRSDSAINIIKHRDGPDAAPGTADDDLFDSREELEAVHMVGDWTIDQLIRCAKTNGYLPTVEEIALVNFLNDYKTTDFERLDEACGLHSDSARNLLLYRDGPDGIPDTADDNPFHSQKEVDGIAQVGEWTMEQLFACAEKFGYLWKPVPLEYQEAHADPGIGVHQQDGIIYIEDQGAEIDADVVFEFGSFQIGMTKRYNGFTTRSIEDQVPDGYGASDLPYQAPYARIQVTKDPPGTLSTKEALQAARADLIWFLQEERMHEPDWQAQMPQLNTWEACLEEGIMEGIDGFGDLDNGSDASHSRRPTEYQFSGRGPLGLHTRVTVSKPLSRGIWFHVEID